MIKHLGIQYLASPDQGLMMDIVKKRQMPDLARGGLSIQPRLKFLENWGEVLAST